MFENRFKVDFSFHIRGLQVKTAACRPNPGRKGILSILRTKCIYEKLAYLVECNISRHNHIT